MEAVSDSNIACITANKVKNKIELSTTAQPSTTTSSSSSRSTSFTNKTKKCLKRKTNVKTSKKRLRVDTNPSTSASEEEEIIEQSYGNPDIQLNQILPFEPARLPGPQLDRRIRQDTSTALAFFSLYFDNELIDKIVKHTNQYGHLTILKKPSYARKDGAWAETTPQEVRELIALLLYHGLVSVSTFSRYWSSKSLYNGLWSGGMMSRNRFTSLMSMIHVSDPALEGRSGKLRKVSEFTDAIKQKCKELYQPYQNVSIDERIVKSKHRSGIRQYIKNKPVKFGLKLWVLADSKNGYTYDFDVYAGKDGKEMTREHGLGYSVVMKLMSPLMNQGYHLYTDNFYTSVTLYSNLFVNGVYCCGTTAENRKGFPDSMKGGKLWAKGRERGEMRWKRNTPCLALQWKDNKIVTMLSTIHNANDHITVKRKVKIGDQWEKVDVQKPKLIESYNAYMNGVDRSDQFLAKNNLLRKCLRWWKTLFFHMIDIAAVNSFILFQEYRKSHPDIQALQRPASFALLDFREELVRNLLELEEYSNPPIFRNGKQKDLSVYSTEHIPLFSETRKNCKVCYKQEKAERRVFSYCSAPQ